MILDQHGGARRLVVLVLLWAAVAACGPSVVSIVPEVPADLAPAPLAHPDETFSDEILTRAGAGLPWARSELLLEERTDDGRIETRGFQEGDRIVLTRRRFAGPPAAPGAAQTGGALREYRRLRLFPDQYRPLVDRDWPAAGATPAGATGDLPASASPAGRGVRAPTRSPAPTDQPPSPPGRGARTHGAGGEGPGGRVETPIQPGAAGPHAPAALLVATQPPAAPKATVAPAWARRRFTTDEGAARSELALLRELLDRLFATLPPQFEGGRTVLSVSLADGFGPLWYVMLTLEGERAELHQRDLAGPPEGAPGAAGTGAEAFVPADFARPLDAAEARRLLHEAGRRGLLAARDAAGATGGVPAGAAPAEQTVEARLHFSARGAYAREELTIEAAVTGLQFSRPGGIAPPPPEAPAALRVTWFLLDAARTRAPGK